MTQGSFKKAVIVKGTGVEGFSDAIFISDGEQDELFLPSSDGFICAADRIAGKKPRKSRKRAEFFAGAVSGVLFSVIIRLIYGIINAS